MIEKYIVKVTLAILGTNLQTGEHYIASLEKDKTVLPYTQLLGRVEGEVGIWETPNIQQLIGILEQLYIDLDSNWIQNKLVSCIVENDTLVLLYICHIPLDTILKKIYWIPILQCPDNIIITEVLKNIL